MVVRRPDENDGRVLRVFLTKAGKDLKEKLISCAEIVLEKSGRDLTKEELTQFKRTLNKVLSNLE